MPNGAWQGRRDEDDSDYGHRDSNEHGAYQPKKKKGFLNRMFDFD